MRWPKTIQQLVAALAASIGAACTGTIGLPDIPLAGGPEPGAPGPGGGDDPDTPAPVDCTQRAPASIALRRMSDVQYANTIRDVFGGLVEAPRGTFPATNRSIGYTTAPEANIVSQLGAEEILESSEAVGVAVAGRVADLLPCASTADERCAETFIETYGRRAFRRPVRAEERDLLIELFRDVRADTPFAESIGIVAATIVEMPQFLYFIEEGEPIGDGVVRLTDHEIATRLSFLVWNTTPDDALLAAADRGELGDPGAIEAAARRLLGDPRALDGIKRFHREWLQLEDPTDLDKDRRTFPEFTSGLSRAISEESDRFVEAVMTRLGGTLDALLTSRVAVVNRTIAPLYGLDPSVSSDAADWQVVDLDPSRRSGVLTRAAFLATHANPTATSPIFRGKFVRTRLLCTDIPPPPPDAMNMLPDFPAEATQREKSEILMAAPACGGCHRLMNPIGFGFENYDALGKWQTEDNGKAIEARGTIVGGPGFTDFDGATDLSAKLATSDVVRDCFVRQWFRYGFGKREASSDSCTIGQVNEKFAGSSYSIGELIVSLTASDAFTYQRPIEGGGE